MLVGKLALQSILLPHLLQTDWNIAQMKTILLFFARPFAPFYAAIMRLRQGLYHYGIFTSEKPQVPVISVGNLVLGGTGKTPMVRYLVTLLQENGCNPAIISRGYKGAAKKSVNIVASEGKIHLSAKEAGDEPCMLAASLPQTMVLTGKKRINPAKKAVVMGADCLILDDGFQHLAIKRDVDIVLFDAFYQAGNSRLLPAGPLREPVAALHRADCFMLTGVTTENRERAGKFAQLLKQRFPATPVFLSERSALSFYNLQGSPCARPAETLLAFCGIAQPERFRKSLDDASVDVREFIALADHAPYTLAQIKKLEKKAAECGATALVTTEKDGVKLRDFSFSLPIFIAGFTMKTTSEFTQFIENHPALADLFCTTKGRV